MTKAVIFDFDGLLVDTEIVSYQIYKEMLREFGYGLSVEDYAQTYCGHIEERNIAHLIETYKLPWTLEAGLEKLLQLENRLLAQGAELKSGAKELLTFLTQNGYKLAVASSSTKDRALGILKAHGIVDCFDAFVFAEEIKKGKPEPEVFLKACGKLEERPEDCLVLEDSEAGIQAANAAGVPVICIPDMKKPDKDFLEKTAAVLDSLDEVILYLLRE